MASRRLDIGSLLCDNNEPAFSPLEVLVQAATEERKRLGAVDDSHKHSSSDSKSPVIDNHVAHSPLLSPHLSRRHDDSQRILHSQQPLYLQRTRPHHDNLAYAQHSQSSRDFEFSLETDRRRRLHDADRQQRLQEQHRLKELEYHRQQQELERVYRAQEVERRRREEDHLRKLEYQREVELLEAEQRQQLLAEEKRREMERQRELEERRLAEKQLEIERHRAATEKQHSHQFATEQPFDIESRSFFEVHPQQLHTRLSPVVATVSISHLMSDSDPPQIRQSTSSISPESSVNLQHDPRPIKKRRFSISPTRHDDQEHLSRDRDRMAVGDLGYGRVDSPVASPSAPRRPGSHNQPRMAVAVADLLVDKEPPASSPLSHLARPDFREIHKALSPTSRRSPPGSQIGRAKAARKSDEYMASLREHVQPPLSISKEHVQSILPTKSTEDPKVKQEPKTNRLRYTADEIRRTPTVDEPRQKKAPPPPAPKMQPSDSKSKQRDDPHEFFLHQYDQVPTPAKSAKFDPGHMPAPSSNPTSPTPIAVPKTSPAVSAVATLDKELEDLISSPTSSRIPTSSAPTVKIEKQEESDDMDLAVDLAVTELVKHVENDDEKHVGMEVDVEDELLSLVDDRLPPTTNSLRRPSASSSTSAPKPHVSDLHSQDASVTGGRSQPMIRNASEKSSAVSSNVLASGVAVQASGFISHSSSARGTSDRESMPPPPITTNRGTGKKAAELAPEDSTVPTEPPSAPSVAGKKKRETTVKV